MCDKFQDTDIPLLRFMELCDYYNIIIKCHMCSVPHMRKFMDTGFTKKSNDKIQNAFHQE